MTVETTDGEDSFGEKTKGISLTSNFEFFKEIEKKLMLLAH